jgi:hypothetical protein
MIAASARFRSLVASPSWDLDALMRRGGTPDPDALAGVEYRGANTAAWMARLRMQQFIKGFQLRPDGGLLGYNRRVPQDGRWAVPGRPFGFFDVREVDPATRDNYYLQSLLLDYRAGGNPTFDPSRTIRDYLVRVDPRSDDLLVGRAFLAIGPFRPSPSYFLLERLPGPRSSPQDRAAAPRDPGPAPEPTPRWFKGFKAQAEPTLEHWGVPDRFALLHPLGALPPREVPQS